MNDTMTNPPLAAGTGEDSTKAAAALGPTDLFVHRHIGPDEAEQQEMLSLLGYGSLDELIDATAAAEAMSMCRAIVLDRDEETKAVFFVAEDCHPQTIAVCRTRAKSMGIEPVVGNAEALGGTGKLSGLPVENAKLVGLLLQY